MNTQSRTQLLQSNPRNLTDSAQEGQRVLTTMFPAQEYPAGVKILKQGTVCDSVYLVESGLVKITNVCETGREIILSLRSSSWMLGAPSVLLHKPNPFEAITVTYSQLRRIPAEAFVTMVTTNIACSHLIQQALSREIYEHITPMIDLGCCSARERLERFLWTLISRARGQETGEGVRLAMPLRHWEAAQFLAITPAYLSRLLKQMEDEKVLYRKDGFLVVPNPHKLRPGNGPAPNS